MMCEDVRQVYPTEDGEVEALAGVSKEFEFFGGVHVAPIRKP